MKIFVEMVVPLVLLAVCSHGMMAGVDVYGAMVEGGKRGLQTVVSILPSLVILLTVVSMLRVSGALDWLAVALTPILYKVGLPSELLPLMLLRPLSGSAALGIGSELMSTYGVDSHLGRITAVMLGSTETTFYTIAVYFGAVGITRTRYAVPAALCADLAGFLAATWAVGVVFG